jgi:anti-sigma factor ChrR (cupin superfamily)
MIEKFAVWPTDVLRPTGQLQNRLAARIADAVCASPAVPAASWSEPDWEHVAPGIDCKLLATDSEQNRVSMLVRLVAGASYPSHIHAGTEELYLLSGELWIDDRKLMPGDYNYGAPNATDRRVWSTAGCTCLLITNTQDILLT